VEASNQILAFRQVDTRFPAHRTVNHRQQRGWHHDQRNAPVESCRGKTSQITNYPATNGNYRGVPVCGKAGKRGIQLSQSWNRFSGLSKWQNLGISTPTSIGESLHHRTGAWSNIGISHDQSTARCHTRGQLLGQIIKASGDGDGITTWPKINLNHAANGVLGHDALLRWNQ
jgi:hypothetical protein